jgi:arabinofuranan 3-O-arabinosyltransferase
VVNENFNAGWQASLGRTRLWPVRIDGWKQAWLLSAGTAGTVTLTYPPDRVYRDAIAGGLGTLALVVLVALWPARRRVGEGGRRTRWLPKRSRAGRSQEAEQAREAAPSQEAEVARDAEPAPDAGAAQETEPSRDPGAARDAGAVRETELAREPESARLPRWLRRPLRVRPRWSAALTSAAAVCGLLLAGLWLGGYPGAVILAATACLFTAAFSWRHRHRLWLELSRPWLVAALLLAAGGCSVVGQRLLAEGASGTLVTGLTSTAPQVICLVIVGRLAAALFVGDPE